MFENVCCIQIYTFRFVFLFAHNDCTLCGIHVISQKKTFTKPYPFCWEFSNFFYIKMPFKVILYTELGCISQPYKHLCLFGGLSISPSLCPSVCPSLSEHVLSSITMIFHQIITKHQLLVAAIFLRSSVNFKVTQPKTLVKCPNMWFWGIN